MNNKEFMEANEKQKAEKLAAEAKAKAEAEAKAKAEADAQAEAEAETAEVLEAEVVDAQVVEDEENADAQDEDAQEAEAEETEHVEVKVEPKEIVQEVVDELGIISEDTRIEGDITTKGHLAIDGYVEGNVKAKGNIIVRGMIKGTIACDNLILENCNLVTEINATGQVSVKGGTISGKIKCKDISVNGTVNADIDASESIALSSVAVVNGNIKAGRIGMEFGAILNGSISMTR